MTDKSVAEQLAERIASTCTDAMLDYGEALNRAAADKGNELLKTSAQHHGVLVARLAAGLAAKLRPRKP